MSLTFEEAHALFDYDPDTGQLTWAEGAGTTRHGRHAGSLTNGRLQVRIDRGRYALANRIAWVWMTGKWLSGNMRHLDGDATNIEWANIEPCNATYTPSHYLQRVDGKWFCVIAIGGTPVQMGPFSGSKQAAFAFKSLVRTFVGVDL